MYRIDEDVISITQVEDVCASFNQGVDDLRISRANRQCQDRIPLPIGGLAFLINAGASRKQKSYGLCISAADGVHQRRISAGIKRVDVQRFFSLDEEFS